MSPKRKQPERKRSTIRPRGAADGGNTPRRSRPLPRGDSFYTPHAHSLRRAVEQRSAVVLVWLHHSPPWVLPAAIVAVFAAGLLLPGVAGTVLLTLLAGFFAWLAFIAWPALTLAGRALRVSAVLALLGLGLLQQGVF